MLHEAVDLVLTGAAKTEFEAYEVKVRIDTSILKSPAMVALAWQRTVGNPAYLACTSKDYMQRATPGSSLSRSCPCRS